MASAHLNIGSYVFAFASLFLAIVAPSVQGHVAVYDEYWTQRQTDALRQTIKSYDPNPFNVTDHFNYHAALAMETTGADNGTRRELRQVRRGRRTKRRGGRHHSLNAIDKCWRGDKNWHKNRKKLADCVLGFGRRTTGGKKGQFYVVTDASDHDLVNPKPGTLRHAVTRTDGEGEANGEGSSPRFYVGHSIYKGKAALTIEPRAPEFVALESGAFKLSKEGFLLLQFAPAAGVRQYDWSRKQVFSLSVTEIGNVVSLGPRESCVQNKLLNVDESVYIPITKAEFAVLISAFNFILPHLIGWQAFASSIKPEDSNRLNNASPKYGGDYEWSVQNKLLNVDESVYIPITKAEFAVLISAFNFILPHLIGWQAFASSIKPEDSNRLNNASPKYGGDYEWSR
ncbi:hypothetical protein F2Q68_00036144 [Brassica cretica]|uniref:Pectate lyase N-terminal domain-containing protein n=1 Tax=Brassica cretica TaxID=69181 RepID=A0A8S9H334_BRACR|nr:hypothetical protein F2Q68_00036144 [Brassica cretica]